MSSKRPTGAHLVGSIAANTAEEAFVLAMENMGDRLERLPDGEVGERDTWIRWQHARIGASEQLEIAKVDNVYVPVRPYRFVDGTESADEITFPNLGYADAAIESYAVFSRLVDGGTIPGKLRFQAGLPTPLSVALFYVEPNSRTLFEKAYERALFAEIARMLEHIPAEKLAIQWETVSEFALLEGLMQSHIDGDLMDEITSRVAGLVNGMPGGVEVGIHLCYGDSGHKHFCEPTDAGFLARVSAGVLDKATRPIGWIHMPVPKERDDTDYFAPLAALDLPETTRLYLGLVHHTGGREGTERRVQAASRVVSGFGVATECGLGRRDPGTMAELMRQHADVAGPVN
ncbi:MAG: hypothetical protein OEM63_13455 [Gammaproteobacteria bacterium]|nr:hypothetical protein [Gammaproteobacteria bacterium]